MLRNFAAKAVKVSPRALNNHELSIAEAEREIFLLIYFENLTLKDISDII